MLIQMRDYLLENGGSASEISLNGQEKIGTTWSICKMNMLLHGISHADIRQEDTLSNPQHLDDKNELMRFDRVVANPPFSQNYKKSEIKRPGRFPVWLPEKGKKADLMFVQHMLSVLKHNGRLATVMPHGVLFRGGEERDARKHFITQGYLEAVIGLPSNLFYGTGIPACILVMNKHGAATRKSVLFINADREYREGKAQNHLRPEDIDKIIHAYRIGEDIPGYARQVSIEEIQAEDYNCNIRRYVDNAPPPEPQDVRAHLHGGVPLSEINALQHYWDNYVTLREALFVARDHTYADFSAVISSKRSIAEFVNAHPSLKNCHQQLIQTLHAWWQANVNLVEALAPNPETLAQPSGNIYTLRKNLLGNITQALSAQNLLTPFQVRGAFANYMAMLKADFKSIAASGWGAELIPDQEILQSQFPEVLEELEQAQARLAELQALFAAADEEDFDDTEDTGVLPSGDVKAKKDELKTSTAEWKAQLKLCKDLAASLFLEIKVANLLPKTANKAFYCSEGFAQQEPQFDNAQRIISLAQEVGVQSEYIEPLCDAMVIGKLAYERAQAIAVSLERHKKLEDDVKAQKSIIKANADKRDLLVESARAKITQEEAREIIIERLHKTLIDTYKTYLRAEQRACIAAIENLWQKYAVTAKTIEAERDAAARELQAFLVELGYE